MTELQKCEYEILREVDLVCAALNVPYYMVCGSALGAVKYAGFIPWDDDIDIGMLRPDYERFIKEAPALLPEHLFLQNYQTDKEFPHIFSKLRDSNTTYIEKSSANLKINHGVFIDIFPLDGYPRDAKTCEGLEKKKRFFRFLCECGFDFERSAKAELVTKALRRLGVHKRVQKIAKTYTKLISAYHVDDSEIICNHGNWQGKLEYAPKWHYGNGTWAEFEGLKVRVPENYDAYLTQKYGDWRADLPEEEKVGHHYYIVCDVTKPYTEYFK